MQQETIKYLTKDQWARFLATVANPRDRALFLVAYWHGLRASELGMIQVSDVDLADDKIAIRRLKRSNNGAYPMAPDELRAVKAWLKVRKMAAGPLFPGRNGGLTRGAIWLLMRRYGKLSSLPSDRLHPHVLKHSRATHMLDEGFGIADVQDWLGHKDVRNTAVYATITNARRKEVAAGMFAAAATAKHPVQRKPKAAWVTPIIED